MPERPDIVSADDLPTLSDLYAKGEISEPKNQPLYPPDGEINNCIIIWRGGLLTWLSGYAKHDQATLSSSRCAVLDTPSS